MPVQSCSSNGKSGKRWGNTGKCYTGPKATQKAIKQGVAIEGPAKVSKIMKASSAPKRASRKSK